MSNFEHATAYRNNLILQKLDLATSWRQVRHGNDIVVERREGRIVKTMRGLLAGLQDHEIDAYVAVWKGQANLRRVATFKSLESAESDMWGKTIVLKDYGPDLLDWLHLLCPPRLEPEFFDANRSPREQLVGFFCDPRVLLALVRAQLEALAPFHREGFVHCDIKPDNFCVPHRIAGNSIPTLSHAVNGEIDLDGLTVIDLGCSLLPVGGGQRRRILETPDKAPLFIGAAMARNYIWPALLGANNENEARDAAQRICQQGWDGKQVAMARPDASRYVSDHYLLCYELARLGSKDRQDDVLNRLDWRIDLYSLGHLLEGILSHITDARVFEPALPEMIDFLEGLPDRLRAYDSSPFEVAPQLPHDELIAAIDALIGADAYRRVPFSVMPFANPVPWFEGPPETLMTPMVEDVLAGAQETRLRTDRGAPWQAFGAFSDFDEAPVLIALSAGSGWVGSPESEPGRLPDESLPREVAVEGFALGKFPVTFDEWDRFTQATGYTASSVNGQGWGRGRHPVVNVGIEDIHAYLAWLNQVAGWGNGDKHRFRLPTEVEWEYAARAGIRTAFPGGNELLPEQAQFHFRPLPSGLLPRDRSAPVGSFPANPWGFHDSIGNVWEVVAASDEQPVLRGGSWLNGPRFLRFAARQQLPGRGNGSHIGFRVVRTLG